jgi:ribonucleoside-triphosphate reductase
MLLIIKRDGSITEFNREKIEKAVLAAFDDVDGEITDYARTKAANIAEFVEEKADEADHELTVEEIQDLVENGLMSCKRKDVARAYIQYRYERTRVREHNTKFMQEVARKLDASDVQNQNANVDEHSFGGRMGEANRALTKKFALDYCMSEMSRNNHLNNYIYIHDLDSYAVGMHNCLTIPFDKLLAEGFNTRQTDVRPANSVNTAFQLVAVIFQLQSLQQFGGVSASHIDWTMVPYVRKSFNKHFIDGIKYILGFTGEGWETYRDESIESQYYKQYSPKVYQYAMDMTKKEIHQAVEGMYHNLNTLQSRSGN